jgi:hypothetical protein
MVSKFDQRLVNDNFLTRLRKLSEDIESLKFRKSLGSTVVVSRTSGGGMTISSAAVTSSNVTGVAGVLHNLDLSGLTGNRDFNLPTPTAANELCGVRVAIGDSAYALIVKRNSTEVARTFITDEILIYQSTGTGAGDWVLIQNGLIKCLAVMERTTAQSISTSSGTQDVEFNSAPIDVGNMADITTNYQATVRREGPYEIGTYIALNGIDDGESLQAHIYINGALVDFGSDFSPSSNRFLADQVIKKYYLNVGDTVKMYVYHTEGASLNTDTTYKPQLWVEEVLGAGGVSGGGSSGSASQEQIMAIASIGI